MPNVYRKKICPNCDKEHRQRGPYCSKSCSNLARAPMSPVTKSRISHGNMIGQARRIREEGGLSDHLIANQLKLAAKHAENPEDHVVNPDELYLPPMTRQLDDGWEVSDGDLWKEVD